jgi:hypothetical protein
MQDLEWKWVIIGAVIIIALNQATSFLLAEPVAVPLVLELGMLGGLLVFALLIGLLSYFVGGVIVGRMSPGETVREPAVASLFAVGLNLVLNIAINGQVPSVLGIAIAAGLGFGLGLAGGKVGEAWQARSVPAQPAVD